MSRAKTRPFDIDHQMYPFKANWFQRGTSSMHYVDEGNGLPVVMLHGNPTWSFLYRNVIKQLVHSGRFRCIAPDYPGFGCSDHPEGYGYTPQEHAEWIERLIDELALDQFILVGQDWGGPIGLSVALKQPKRLAGLVLGNTWGWPVTFKPRMFSYIMGSRFPGKYLQINKNYFARSIVPSGISKSEQRRPDILSHYTRPFPDKMSRQGTWIFPRALRTASQWLAELEKKLSRLDDIPVELVWGMKDFAFGDEYYINRWQSYFSKARVTMLEDASHYLQEDRPDAVADAIVRTSQNH